MKKYLFVEPDSNMEPVEIIYTEEDILNEYWSYWKDQMEKKYGPNDPAITYENCIEDWIAVNWAIEV